MKIPDTILTRAATEDEEKKKKELDIKVRTKLSELPIISVITVFSAIFSPLQFRHFDTTLARAVVLMEPEERFNFYRRKKIVTYTELNRVLTLFIRSLSTSDVAEFALSADYVLDEHGALNVFYDPNTYQHTPMDWPLAGCTPRAG